MQLTLNITLQSSQLLTKVLKVNYCQSLHIGTKCKTETRSRKHRWAAAKLATWTNSLYGLNLACNS